MGLRVRFYREKKSGDFLVVHFGKEYECPDGTHSARAVAISGNVTSVCTTSVSGDWLREECVPVLKQDVPKNWLNRF